MAVTKEKVLVTGGAGFIGSHVVERLVREGHKTLVVDDLETGDASNVPKRVKLHKIDVWNDYKKLYALFEKERPEVVIHLAAHKDVRGSVREPVKDAHTNIIGTLNVLEGMCRGGGGRVIFASSVAVCSSEAKLPIDESCKISPRSPYGIGKRAAEMYLWHYSETHEKLAGVSLRPTNVYGPRQSLEGAGIITIIIEALLKGETPEIFGTGEQTRDFIYVEDVVDAMMRAMRVAWCGELVLGTGVETSINTLYTKIAHLLGSSVKSTHSDARDGELFRNYADSKLALEVMGWKAQTQLDDGLKKTVEWFLEARKTS